VRDPQLGLLEPGFFGMSLRDWFAGMTLAGISANPDWRPTDPSSIAADAYRHADAMLAARQEEPK
jgi:hypothetical protein